MRKFLTPMAAALLAVGLLLPAAAGAADLEPVARMSAGATSIDWQPLLTSHEGMVLTVSTPSGHVIRREFRAGETPTFSIFDSEGKARRNGSYTYELRALPAVSKEVREALRAYRESGDRSLLAGVRERLPQGTFVQSGSFAIADGAFLSPIGVESTERNATKGLRNTSGKALRNVTANDQVIPDDLIVQGSTCVGFDCVNNESFGFDTIRLKENNTRIKFEDTSVGSYPSNDWQLTANDSASGGASKFSIEDITGSKVPFTITAGASTNSIFVDSTGRVGFRTSTPVLDLHVATSNTPAIRLEQNSSGGFTAQTWDIAGNEANFFVRDVTGGSRLPFRIRPGAPTSAVDISADGDVGVGTAGPDERLHVFENVNENSFILMENANSGVEAVAALRALSNGATVNFQSHSSGRTLTRFGVTLGSWAEMLATVGNGLLVGTNGPTPLILGTNATNRVHVDTDGDVGINCNNPTADLMIASGGGCANPSSSLNAGATQFTVASSRSFKENAARLKIPDILDKISGIDVYKYDFIAGPKDRIGLMAEDFHEVFGRGSEKYLDGSEVQMALWLAVQQLTARNQELTERLSALESKLADDKSSAAAEQDQQ